MTVISNADNNTIVFVHNTHIYCIWPSIVGATVKSGRDSCNRYVIVHAAMFYFVHLMFQLISSNSLVNMNNSQVIKKFKNLIQCSLFIVEHM